MKNKKLIILCCLLVAVSLRGEDLTITLATPVEQGSIELQLFDSSAAFRKLIDPVQVQREEACGQKTIRLQNIPPGIYAVAVYNDLNNNGRLDRNFIGIPSEPVGFANGYTPKGPPFYNQAQIRIDSGGPLNLPVELSNPLGARGQIGVGIGTIVRSSPYKGSGGATIRAIPSIIYIGDRLQVFGPNARYDLLQKDKLRLAAALRYRFAAYDEDDSSALKGMGDRDGTLMGGFALRAELLAGLEATLSASHDLLNNIGGSEASLKLDRTFEPAAIQLTPHLGVNWTAARLANHDYGVSSREAAAGRPTYDTGDIYTLEAGLSFRKEISERWILNGSLAVERLPDDVSNSPIVSDSYLLKGLIALNYVF